MFYVEKWNVETLRMKDQLANISILEAQEKEINRSIEYINFKQIVFDSLGKKGYEKWLAGDHKTHFNKILKICEKYCKGMDAQTIFDVLGEPDIIDHNSKVFLYEGEPNMGVPTIKFWIENNKVFFVKYVFSCG